MILKYNCFYACDQYEIQEQQEIPHDTDKTMGEQPITPSRETPGKKFTYIRDTPAGYRKV
jgi:hypothetical protein